MSGEDSPAAYCGPGELAHELRERFRAEHQGCVEHICPFPNLYAEDIDEVLSAAGVPALRAELERLRGMRDRAQAFLADDRMYGTHNVIRAILGELS